MRDNAVEKGSISVKQVNEALLELRRRGGDPLPLLAQAGITAELLNKSYGRVSAVAYSRLWLLIAQAMDDEFFGMNGRRMKVGSFAFMCRTALHEPTLEGALKASLRFLALLFDDLQPLLMRKGGLAQICLREPAESCCRAFSYFTLWMIVHGLACWLAGRRIPILALELRCAAPDHLEDYRVMFSENLRFSRPQSRLLFKAQWLDLPVRRSQQELRDFLAGAPANILVKYRDSQSLAARSKAYLRSIKPAHWPDFAALAGHFFMATSTLRRKLAQEGQTYQSLKDQLRRDLAIARLDSSAGNLSDLAFELGFADTSAFYKAFKKWTGSTPGQYRAVMHAESCVLALSGSVS